MYRLKPQKRPRISHTVRDLVDKEWYFRPESRLHALIVGRLSVQRSIRSEAPGAIKGQPLRRLIRNKTKRNEIWKVPDRNRFHWMRYFSLDW